MLSAFALVMFATLAVFAMPAAAQEVYLVPQTSSASYGGEVEVQIWVDATGFSSGQINLTYDPTCANVTNWAGNTAIFPMGTWTHSTGEDWITFSAPASTLTGEYMIGTLTVQCVCEDECSTTLDFVDPSKLFDPSGGEIAGVTWTDGTFECVINDISPPAIDFIAPPTPVDGSTVTVNYVNVTVNVTDPSGVSTVLLNWNGLNETMNMTADNTWSVNKTGLSNGDYTFKVYANDTAGNMGVSETRVVTVNVGAAEHEGVYLEPQSSSASCGGETEVQIWVNATNFQSGQINLTYDPTCVNVTNWAENTATFPVGTWTHSTGGEWITFASMSSLSGEYKIGTLTIQCVCEDKCSTTLNFVDPSKLFDPSGGEIAGVTWTDGTFECTSGICGDVAPYPGGDGVINMGDVIRLLNHVGNPTEFPVDSWAGDCKCTGDGVINMGDVILLLNHVGNPEEFPLECC